jgi:acyl carrier protein
VLALEDRFGIEVEGEDISAEVFETLATLTAFVDGKLG